MNWRTNFLIFIYEIKVKKQSDEYARRYLDFKGSHHNKAGIKLLVLRYYWHPFNLLLLPLCVMRYGVDYHVLPNFSFMTSLNEFVYIYDVVSPFFHVV